MRLHTHAISNLYDCIAMAVEDFKKRLMYEGLDEDEEETENDD